MDDFDVRVGTDTELDKQMFMVAAAGRVFMRFGMTGVVTITHEPRPPELISRYTGWGFYNGKMLIEYEPQPGRGYLIDALCRSLLSDIGTCPDCGRELVLSDDTVAAGDTCRWWPLLDVWHQSCEKGT